MTDGPPSAADRWRQHLAEWAIPSEILGRAPSEPYVFPVEMFAAPAPGGETAGSTRIAAEVLDEGSSVLDVGCGGGAAALALAPPASTLFGFDRQADMIELFLKTSDERGIEAHGFVGSWPDDAARVPRADVVVSHNVLYNVGDLEPFARALDRHARRRVVIEITEQHPQTSRAPLWKHFWGIDRPTEPTAWTAAEALSYMGFDVQTARTKGRERDLQRAAPVEAAFWCRQLCLPPERETEVAELVSTIQFPRERVSIWWDVQAPSYMPLK